MVRWPGRGRGRGVRPRPRRRSASGCTSTSASGHSATATGSPCTRSCRSTGPAGGRGGGPGAARAAFARSPAASPTHLDSHQHVHSWESGGRDLPAAGARTRRSAAPPPRRLRYCGDLYGHDGGQADPRGDHRRRRWSTSSRSLAPGVTELACHPGLGADTGSAYDREREQEVEVLCDPRVAHALRARGRRAAVVR